MLAWLGVGPARAKDKLYAGPVPPVYGAASDRALLGPLKRMPQRGASPHAFGDGQPECDVPVYSFEEWERDHGRDFPAHPAIFAADPSTATRGFGAFPDMDRFLELFGNETVEALPGYAQAGGQYCTIGVPCRVRRTAPLRDLARDWTGELTGFSLRGHRSGSRRRHGSRRRRGRGAGSSAETWSQALQRAESDRAVATRLGAGAPVRPQSLPARAPPLPPRPRSRFDVRADIIQIYQLHNPAKIDKVDFFLDQAGPGREEALLGAIRQKYGLVPAAYEL